MLIDGRSDIPHQVVGKHSGSRPYLRSENRGQYSSVKLGSTVKAQRKSLDLLPTLKQIQRSKYVTGNFRFSQNPKINPPFLQLMQQAMEVAQQAAGRR